MIPLSPETEGAIAYALGREVTECPYLTTDDRYPQWLAGFMYAQEINTNHMEYEHADQ